MLYQIIISTSEIMTDEEILERAKRWIPSYLVVEAQSLDGIREETYRRHEDLSDLL